MKTAFVLGGGGLLGAHEVGMLRALSERWHRTRRDRGHVDRRHQRRVRGCRPGGRGGPAAPDVAGRSRCGRRSAGPCGAARCGWRVRARICTRWTRSATCCAACFPRPTSRTSKLPFHCVAASIERAQARWFSSGPIVPAVLASCAVPGLLPPVEIDGEHFFDGGLVHSIPVGRAVALGASTIYVLHVGRIERPLTVPRRPWEVGLVAFEIARRHRFHEEMATLPADVTGPRASRGDGPAPARPVAIALPRPD